MDSIRKLPKMGSVYDKIDFEWPKREDLLEMLKTGLTFKVKSFSFKESTYCSDRFGAIQVNLTNGKSSPVFTAVDQSPSGLKTINIPDSSLIRKVVGRSIDIGRVEFYDDKGNEIAGLRTDDSGSNESGTGTLNEGEEVIGLYGYIGT